VYSKAGGFIATDNEEEDDDSLSFLVDNVVVGDTATNNGHHGKQRQQKKLTREKAAVAVEIKHGAKMFSSPIDPSICIRFEPKVYPKSKSDELFLLSIMKRHLLFEELSSDELQILIEATERIQVAKGEKVVQQNDRGEFLYIVQRGKLELFCEVGQHPVGKVLEEGNVFGELALLYGNNCSSSVIAKTSPYVVVWRIDQMTFRRVLVKHAYQRDVGIQNCLKRVSLFQGMSDAKLGQFAAGMTRVHFERGSRIVKKGEMGEVFYSIERGSVRVHDIGIGDSQSTDRILKRGESFGERALLTGEPRSATVTAIEDVVALAMDRATFQSSLGDLRHLMKFHSKLSCLKALPIFANSDLTELELQRLADLTKEVCYKKGTKLCQAGRKLPRSSCVWFIEKGRLLVYDGGKKKSDPMIYNLQTGDYFGEKSILDDDQNPDRISSYEATCETNLTTYKLSRESIESVVVDLTRLGESESYVKSKQKLHQKSSTSSLKHFTHYHIIGMGGFGKVWLVENKGNGNLYALKVIHKRKLLNSRQERSILREKELLQLLHHPFILHSVSSFQDASNLYLVLPLIRGGELYDVVGNSSKRGRGLPNDDAAFYAGGVIEALGHFHHRYIAYRDLKLENIMIDADGYPVIVDLGFAKVTVEKSYTFCGTPDYLAPEIIMSKGHNHAVDYWSFGVLVFEILSGKSPFNTSSSHMEMFKRIVLMQYEMPHYLNEHAQDLIRKLLKRKVSQRLGMLSGGHYDVQNHPWFSSSGCNCKELLKKELSPPWKPRTNSMDPLDASNVQEMITEPDKRPLSKDEQLIFNGF